MSKNVYLEYRGTHKATLEEVSVLAKLQSDKIKELKAENAQLRKDLAVAWSEANRFEQEYIELYKRLQGVRDDD